MCDRRRARRRPAAARAGAAAPGRRVPGCVDPAEIAVRAVLGQQVSVAAARTQAGAADRALRRAACLRRPATVTHLFPTPAALAELDAEQLPMPRARGRSLVDDGRCARRRARPARRATGCLALRGIGPWTADYVAMRCGDPDVLLETDLGVRRGLARLGDPRRARPPRRGLAALALLRRPAPLEPRMTAYTTIDSPIGELLLTGEDGALARAAHVAARTVDAGLGRRDRAALATPGRAARRVLRRRADRVRPAARARPARRSSSASGARCARSLRRDRPATASSRAALGQPDARPRRRRWPTAATRSRSSSRATASSAPTARSPATAAGWSASAAARPRGGGRCRLPCNALVAQAPPPQRRREHACASWQASRSSSTAASRCASSSPTRSARRSSTCRSARRSSPWSPWRSPAPR